MARRRKYTKIVRLSGINNNNNLTLFLPAKLAAINKSWDAYFTSNLPIDVIYLLYLASAVHIWLAAYSHYNLRHQQSLIYHQQITIVHTRGLPNSTCNLKQPYISARHEKRTSYSIRSWNNSTLQSELNNGSGLWWI